MFDKQLEAAIDALCAAMPEATDEELAALLRSRFPEVYEANREAIFEMGLGSLIDEQRDM
jgi:hypothetical protein